MSLFNFKKICSHFREHAAVKVMLDTALRGIVENIDRLPLDEGFNVRS